MFEVWQALCLAIDEKYDMDWLWNAGGKNWTYEYKYRRGGKTLCSLYAKSSCVGFMIIFGKDERAKFEAIRGTLSDVVCRQYDEAKTYHDGKWVMFEPTNTANFDDYMKFLNSPYFSRLFKPHTVNCYVLSLVFALIRVRNALWEDIIQGQGRHPRRSGRLKNRGAARGGEGRYGILRGNMDKMSLHGEINCSDL